MSSQEVEYFVRLANSCIYCSDVTFTDNLAYLSLDVSQFTLCSTYSAFLCPSGGIFNHTQSSATDQFTIQFKVDETLILHKHSVKTRMEQKIIKVSDRQQEWQTNQNEQNRMRNGLKKQ